MDSILAVLILGHDGTFLSLLGFVLKFDRFEQLVASQFAQFESIFLLTLSIPLCPLLFDFHLLFVLICQTLQSNGAVFGWWWREESNT